MAEYNFKKYKLTEDERLWLTELLRLNFMKGSLKHIKVRLLGKIHNEFDSSKIDRRLVTQGRLTLIGLWHVDPNNILIRYSGEVIARIQTLLINDPDLDIIDSVSISSSLNIPKRDIQICLTLLSDFRFFNGGEMKNNEIIFRKVHFTQDHYSFDRVLVFNNLEDSMEKYFNENELIKTNLKSLSLNQENDHSDNRNIKKNKVRKLLARLNGVRKTVLTEPYVRKEVGDDYNLTIKQIEKISKEDLSEFLLPDNFWHLNSFGEKYCHSDKIVNKLFQVIPYLEEDNNVDKDLSEINILFNSINDEELKSRCSDILNAGSHYDRVINQSTQVLEDRIRKKANAKRSLVGTQLINKVLHTDISRSILKVSDNPDEHEGICHICRGIMIGFRNPSHHHLTEKFTQTEALKFCSFIDNILQIIDNAEINT